MENDMSVMSSAPVKKRCLKYVSKL